MEENLNNKKKNRGKILKLLFFISIIIIIVFGIFYGKDFILKDKLYTLSIYKDEYNNICGIETETCNVFAFDIITDGKATLLDSNNNYILYKDETINIYDIFSKNVNKLQLPNNYTKYELAYDTYTNRLMGVIYYDKLSKINNVDIYGVSGFYNIKNNLILYQNRFNTSLKIISNEYLSVTNYDSKTNLFENSLVKLAEEAVVAKSGVTNKINNYEIYENSKGYFIYENIDSDNYNIYGQNGKIITETSVNKTLYSYKDEYLYVYIPSNMQLVQYDVLANIISTRQYNVLDKLEIIALYKNYSIYYQNEKVYIQDLENDYKNVLLDLSSKPDLLELKEENDILYITLYDNINKNKIEIQFNLNTKNISVLNLLNIELISDIKLSTSELTDFFTNNNLVAYTNNTYLGSLYNKEVNINYQIIYTINRVVDKYYNILFNNTMYGSINISKKDIITLVNKIFNLGSNYDEFYNSYSLILNAKLVDIVCDKDNCNIKIKLNNNISDVYNKPGFANLIIENKKEGNHTIIKNSFVYIEPVVSNDLILIKVYDNRGGNELGSYIEDKDMVVYSYDYILEKIENKNTLSYTYEFDENNALISIS